jgi:hypothetical protein
MITDYRLCNYAYCKGKRMHDQEICEVIKVSVKNEITIQGMLSGSIFRRKQLIPVKITGHWLENLGMVYERHGFVKNLEYQVPTYLVLEEVTPEYFELFLQSQQFRLALDPVQYVHQLQNLFFGLTGRQLRLPQLE